MWIGNYFAIHSDSPKTLTLYIEPEGTFFVFV
jgi:hypothetical protein